MTERAKRANVVIEGKQIIEDTEFKDSTKVKDENAGKLGKEKRGQRG